MKKMADPVDSPRSAGRRCLPARERIRWLDCSSLMAAAPLYKIIKVQYTLAK
jgi:hypothetical protein